MTTLSVIHEGLPAESVELKCHDDPECDWKLHEAASVSGGKNLPVLEMCDASLDSGPY